jgi:predicted ABC-type ATPase
LVFVDSADACIQRIHARALKGGHAAPNGDVRRRFRRSLLNFWERYRLDADRWHLTYNGSVGAVRVASGSGTRTLVLEPAIFERWLRLLEAS